MIFDQCSTVASVVWANEPIPAMLQTTEIRPNSETADDTAASTL